jgi:hypothetical protein
MQIGRELVKTENNSWSRVGSLAIVALSTALMLMTRVGLPTRSHAATMSHSVQHQAEVTSIEYRATSFFMPSDNKRFAIIFVTLDTKAFNRGDMRVLASQLKEQFAHRRRLRAALFDDPVPVRLMTEGKLEYPEFAKAQRGLYYLDRIKGKEYVEFLSERQKPGSRVTIRLAGLWAPATYQHGSARLALVPERVKLWASSTAYTIVFGNSLSDEPIHGYPEKMTYRQYFNRAGMV